MDTTKIVGRICTMAYYDLQSIRVSSMNRIRDVIRKKNENIEFDEVEEKKEIAEYGEKYKDENLLSTLKLLQKDNKLTEKELEYLNKVISIAIESKIIENKYKTMMEEYIKTERIYTEFLSKIKGLGVVLSANLIKNLGYCEKFPKVSSLWSYSGYKIINGVAVKRTRGEQIKYSAELKLLGWKIADSFIKCRTPFYRKLYDDEKEKQMKRMEMSDEDVLKANEKLEDISKFSKPKNQQQCHLRAMRKTIKIFLQHYWCCSRELMNLEVSRPWILEHSDGKHVDYLTYKDAIAANIGEFSRNKKVVKDNIKAEKVVKTKKVEKKKTTKKITKKKAKKQI